MKVVIIGGGISGLAAARNLQKRGAEVSLYEASNELGGSMKTKEVNGFRFELGPRTFQTEKCPLLLSLVKELGLEPIFSVGGPRYLWHGNELRAMQSFWPQLMSMLLKDTFTKSVILEDETIYGFALRRCGKKAAELFFDPLAKGVFGGDIRKLSIRSCFPSLFRAKWLAKSFCAKGGLFTVRGGMGKLIEALTPENVHLGARLDQIPDADLVVVATPWSEAAKLCGEPLELRDEKITVVNLGYHGQVLTKKGYGYLVPSIEGERVLGQIWDSSIFPISDKTILTTMVRGDDPKEIALDAMRRHLNIDQPPDAISIQEARIPQYDLYHHQKIADFKARVEKKFGNRVALIGNYLSGASVESCLLNSMSR